MEIVRFERSLAEMTTFFPTDRRRSRYIENTTLRNSHERCR